MDSVDYFAYGSNMSRRRMNTRLPTAQAAGPAILPGHALAFHKVGRLDGSGKCDVVPRKGARVEGVLYTLREADLVRLDACEGRGQGYERITVSVRRPGGERVEAYTYQATRVEHGLRPFGWYHRHVLEGAREAGLSPAYLRTIEAIETVADPDLEREAAELDIYR